MNLALLQGKHIDSTVPPSWIVNVPISVFEMTASRGQMHVRPDGVRRKVSKLLKIQNLKDRNFFWKRVLGTQTDSRNLRKSYPFGIQK